MRWIATVLCAALATAVFLGGCSTLSESEFTHITDKYQAPTIADIDIPEDLPEFNRIVLDVCQEYPMDGTHGYYWPRGEDNFYYDGCTRDMYLMGEKVMTGEAEGRTYCCGFTAEVFVEAYDRWLTEHGADAALLTSETFRPFLRQWFVTEFNGAGPNLALESVNLGETIAKEDWDSALPGDFCNYWRTEEDDGHIGGHSVVFLSWVRNAEGEITGMNYISSQPSTDGIGYRTEWFGSNGGLSRRFFYIGRAQPERGIANSGS